MSRSITFRLPDALWVRVADICLERGELADFATEAFRVVLALRDAPNDPFKVYSGDIVRAIKSTAEPPPRSFSATRHVASPIQNAPRTNAINVTPAAFGPKRPRPGSLLKGPKK